MTVVRMFLLSVWVLEYTLRNVKLFCHERPFLSERVEDKDLITSTFVLTLCEPKHFGSSLEIGRILVFFIYVYIYICVCVCVCVCAMYVYIFWL